MKPKKIAYIEKKIIYNGRHTTWWSDSCRQAAKGFQQLGYKVKGFLKKNLSSLPITKDTVVRGSVHTMRMAFSMLGVKQPANIDIPMCLRKFAHRKIWETDLGKIRKIKNKKVHIKPLEIQKCFNGHVYDEYDFSVSHLPSNLKILASEAVHFEREFRSFVLNGKMIATESFSATEKEFVGKIIKHYKNAPVSYVIDCGWIVSRDWDEFGYMHSQIGELAIIEVNEGFSAGTPGPECIAEEDYAKFIEARWKEVVNT